MGLQHQNLEKKKHWDKVTWELTLMWFTTRMYIILVFDGIGD